MNECMQNGRIFGQKESRKKNDWKNIHTKFVLHNLDIRHTNKQQQEINNINQKIEEKQLSRRILISIVIFFFWYFIYKFRIRSEWNFRKSMKWSHRCSQEWKEPEECIIVTLTLSTPFACAGQTKIRLVSILIPNEIIKTWIVSFVRTNQKKFKESSN